MKPPAAVPAKPAPDPRHNPKTMSYRDDQKEPIKTDRGDFAFRKNGNGSRD